MSVEERLSAIEARNQRVEADKAWETSWARRGSIALITYIVISLTLMVIGHDGAWIHSLIPVIGYLLSTLALRFIRARWQKAVKPLVLIMFLLAPMAAHADITIAIVLPLTSSVAGVGDEMRAGADLAAQDINAKGGEKIVLHYYDDACSTAQAVTLANKIIAEKPVAAFADLCSAATLAAAPVYAEAGLPQITISSNPKITESGFTHLFRFNGRDDSEAPDLIGYLAKKTGPKSKIAVLDDRVIWGIGFADSAIETLKKQKLPFVWRDTVAAGQKDFSSIITKLKQDNITDVVLGVYVQESALLMRQAREQGFKGQFYGGSAIQSSELYKIGGPAINGLIMSGLYDPRDTAEGRSFVDRLKKAGKPFSSYSFYGYAGVELVANAVAQAKSKQPDALIAILRQGVFKTMTGTLSFNAKGDLKDHHFQIFVWQNGDYTPVSTAK